MLPGTMRRLLLATALAALAFVAYVSTGHIHYVGDSVSTSLVAVVILSDASVRLDRFAEAWGSELPYFLARTPRGVVSRYPVAAGLLAAPLMAPALLAPTAPVQAQLDAAHRQEKYAAAFITAVSVAVFALLCWQLGFTDWLTVGLTLFYAFGSQAFSTSSQLLWQHGPGTLLILLAFLCFNFNPATVFLGDSGSMLIGFLLGCFGAVWAQKSATLVGLYANSATTSWLFRRTCAVSPRLA